MSEPHLLERVAHFLGALWQLVMIASSPHVRPPEPVNTTPESELLPHGSEQATSSRNATATAPDTQKNSQKGAKFDESLPVIPPASTNEEATNACKPALSVEHVTLDLLSDFALFHVEASVTQVCTQGFASTRRESTISLWPEGSAMTGLRVATSESDWVKAQHLTANSADRIFSSKRNGRAGERGRLIKLGTATSSNELQIRPFLPGEKLRIAYDALLLTSYAEGVHSIRIAKAPAAEAPGFEFRFPRGGKLVAPSPSNATETVTSKELVVDWQSFAVEMEAELLRTAPGKSSPLAWRVRAPLALGRPPSDASLVVILDKSRSISAAELTRSIIGAKEWVMAHSDPQVLVMSFDRNVEIHTDGFATAAEALKVLNTLQPLRKNGSNIDLALKKAREVLRLRSGRKRILLLTDGAYRSDLNLDRERLGQGDSHLQLMVGIIPHLDSDSNEALLTRLAKRAHGPWVRVAAPNDTLKLARPTTIESGTLWPEPRDCAGPITLNDLTIGMALSAQEQDDNYLLRTQQGHTNMGRVRYSLLGDERSLIVPVDEELSRMQTAWLSGQDNEHAWLATIDGAIEALPPPPPRPERGYGATGYCVGFSHTGTSRSSCGRRRASALITDKLRTQWQNLQSQCGIHGEVTVMVELAGAELLRVHDLKATTTDDTVHTCLIEGLWATELPEAVPEDHCFRGEICLNQDGYCDK